MISDKSKRIMITIDKDLDKAIEEFLEYSGKELQIFSKSRLFTMAIIDWFSNLEKAVAASIKENTNKEEK